MSSRDRSILAVLLLVVVAVGGYFVLVQPRHKKANQLQAQIGTAQTDLVTAKEQVQKGLVAEREYKTYQKQLKTLQAAVPADSQIPSLINELQAAATRTHTGFQAVTLNAAAATAAPASTSPTSFPNQSFTLAFTGTYFSVANLLGTLASYVHTDNKKFKVSGRLLTISSVSFAAATGGFPKVTATVSANDYDIPSGLGTSSATGTAGATS